MTNYNELRDGQEFFANGYKKGYEDAKKEFERPQGEWILSCGTFYCSECNHYAYDNRRFKWCPCCGADMRKPQTQKFADSDTAYGGLASAT